METVERRLRDAHPGSTQYANGSNLLLEAAEQIAKLEQDLGFMQIELRHKTTLLDSCEKSLNERDERIKDLQHRFDAANEELTV